MWEAVADIKDFDTDQTLLVIEIDGESIFDVNAIYRLGISESYDARGPWAHELDIDNERTTPSQRDFSHKAQRLRRTQEGRCPRKRPQGPVWNIAPKLCPPSHGEELYRLPFSWYLIYRAKMAATITATTPMAAMNSILTLLIGRGYVIG